jgi:benzoylformate decarboxylase
MKPVEALFEILRSEGIDRVFGNPGTTELPFTDALADRPGIEYVLGVQEASVVAMADGYARATGTPAFVNLHVAAGLANGLIGMLNALRSRTPMVITAGQQDRRHLLDEPMLAGDLVGIAAAASKSAVEVQHARDLPRELRRAFTLARRPPAGPVFVSVPMDLLAQAEDSTDVDVPERSPVISMGPATGIDDAVRVLSGAERPAIVAGDGVGRDGAVGDLVAVAESLGAAVYHQPMHDGVDFPGSHPLHRGMLLPSYDSIRTALSAHDVVLLAGARAFTAHHYAPGSPVPPGVTLVQVDDDPGEIGRNVPVQVGLLGGIRRTLAALGAELAGRVQGAADRAATIGAANVGERADIDAAARATYGAAPLNPLGAAHALSAGLPAHAVVVEEAITTGMKLRSVLRLDQPGSFVHTVGGGLGWGIGAAIGTRMGRPDRPVVALLGDGCALFGLQGLWSAARYRVPVLFVVFDNGEYRTLKDTLDHGATRSAATGHYVGLDLGPPGVDWAAAAAAFGVRSVEVSSTDQLCQVVAGAPELDGPLLAHVPITPHPSRPG